CYSALLFLLAVYGRQKTVSPTDAMAMIGHTPTGRLEWLLGQPDLAQAHGKISELLAQYELFLKTTNADERELVRRFMDKQTSQSYMGAAFLFGDLVFEVLTSI